VKKRRLSSPKDKQPKTDAEEEYEEVEFEVNIMDQVIVIEPLDDSDSQGDPSLDDYQLEAAEFEDNSVQRDVEVHAPIVIAPIDESDDSGIDPGSETELDPSE